MVFFILLLLLGYKCISCTCMEIIGLNDATSVFEGSVLEIKKITTPYECNVITVKVDKYIKGAYNADTLYVQTPCLYDACCGVPFAIKDKYIIYAIIKDNMLYTNVCSETKKLP